MTVLPLIPTCCCIALSVSWPAHGPAMQTSGALGVPAQAPPRSATTVPSSGTAVIRGHVLDRESGRPLRLAVVHAYAAGLREPKTANTDEQGRYELKDLPAGRYTISAWKGSYVRLTYGQTRPVDPGKPLEILDGQMLERVDFTLTRGGVITGRVVDEYGDPLPNVQMSALRPESSLAARHLSPVGGSSTDDMGEFRIFGLSPGQYYLSATLRDVSAVPSEEDDHTGYAVTYFPATTNASEAQRLTVGIAQTVSDVNIALVPTRTARISGTAVDSRGRPISAGYVTIASSDELFNVVGIGRGAQMRPDGTFTLSGVTPGNYTLLLPVAPALPADAQFATADVTVNGADITDVQLAVPVPSTASGRVVVDPAAAGASLQPQGLRIFAQPKDPGSGFFPALLRPNTVNDDLTFEFKVRPGKKSIDLMGLPSGWTQKSVRVSGVDVTDTGIDFKSTEAVSGIEIEVSNIKTTLSGVVTDSRGQPSRDYYLLVFPQDRERLGSGRNWSSSRPDQDGRYKVTGLPPGQYYAVALESVEGVGSSDPQFVESARARATPFTLGEGETKTLDLKLTSRP